MKSVVNHPEYGEIVYHEPFWAGRSYVTVNGVPVQRIHKRTFLVFGKELTLKGNFLFGASAHIDGEVIRLTAVPRWYEWVLAFLPIVFAIYWGNNYQLNDILPIYGGSSDGSIGAAIGGALGGFFSVLSLLGMKMAKKPLFKVIEGIGCFVVYILLAYLLAILL